MLALAKYALKGPYQAATVVGLLAIAAIFLPLLTGQTMLSATVTSVLIVMASALVGLIILTRGSREGLKAIVASIFGVTLVTTLVLGAPALGISIGLMQWLPIIILAQTLKSSRSLALMILAGLVLAIVAIGLQFLIWPDFEAMLLPSVEQSFARLAENPAFSEEMIADYTRLLAHWMAILLVSMMYLMFIGILLLSRWMQSKLDASDQYKRDFHAIALGKPAAVAGLVIMILGIWAEQDWITSVAIAVMFAFLYQGIAVVHSKLATNKHRTLIFTIFYISLVIFPQVVAISSITGLLDNWLVLRKSKNTGLT